MCAYRFVFVLSFVAISKGFRILIEPCEIVSVRYLYSPMQDNPYSKSNSTVIVQYSTRL